MDAAERMLVATPLAWGAYDLWLAHTGRTTLTCAMRAHPWITGVVAVVVAVHVADRFGKCDPFTVVGRRINRAMVD